MKREFDGKMYIEFSVHRLTETSYTINKLFTFYPPSC